MTTNQRGGSVTWLSCCINASHIQSVARHTVCNARPRPARWDANTLASVRAKPKTKKKRLSLICRGRGCRRSCVIARQMSTNSGQPGWGQSLDGREAATAPHGCQLLQHKKTSPQTGSPGPWLMAQLLHLWQRLLLHLPQRLHPPRRLLRKVSTACTTGPPRPV